MPGWGEARGRRRPASKPSMVSEVSKFWSLIGRLALDPRGPDGTKPRTIWRRSRRRRGRKVGGGGDRGLAWFRFPRSCGGIGGDLTPVEVSCGWGQRKSGCTSSSKAAPVNWPWESPSGLGLRSGDTPPASSVAQASSSCRYSLHLDDPPVASRWRFSRPPVTAKQQSQTVLEIRGAWAKIHACGKRIQTKVGGKKRGDGGRAKAVVCLVTGGFAFASSQRAFAWELRFPAEFCALAGISKRLAWPLL